MEKKTASAIMLTLLLTSMLTLAFNVQPVKAEPADIIIDTEVGESRFTTYPLRQSPYYWVHVSDHDTFRTRAYGGNFWYTLCGAEGTGEPLYYGLWQASLPYSGVYEVFVWIPNPDPFEYGGRVYTPTQSAIYQIYYKDGMTTRTVNQRLRTGGWYSVGTFTFDTTASVILNDRTGEPYLSTMIAFDAIKFVYINNPPVLSNGYVTPSSGDTSTVFEYYVTYADPDGDSPTLKYVYIDGSPYTMVKISGDYVSGAAFKYSTTLSAGSHNYYFYFDDGHGHAVRLPTTGTYSGPNVSPPPPPFDFIIGISPSSGSVQQGGSVSATVTVTLTSGSTQTVTLTTSGLPSGTYATFNPSSGYPTFTSTFAISTSTTTPTGTFYITIIGSGGGLTRTATYTLTVTPLLVPDFSISASPTSLSIQQGSSGSSTITITSINGFNQPVQLSVSGVPSGVTATLSPSQVTPPADGTATSTLTVSVGTAATPGSYTLTVTGNSGALTHSTYISLEIPPAINRPPNKPTAVSQCKSDGVTAIPEGGTTPESTVVFKATVSDPDGDSVRLEIELRQIGEAFTGEPTPETISDFVPSGSQVTITRYGLVNADYHWRYRAKDSHGATSDWTEFGVIGNIDFTVRTLTPAILTPVYGKGVWITYIWLTEGGDLDTIIGRLETAKVKWVAIKCGDSNAYWLREGRPLSDWANTYGGFSQVIKRFHDRGIKVLGAHFIYGRNIYADFPDISETDVSNWILSIDGIDGLLIDVEPDMDPQWALDKWGNYKQRLIDYLESIRASYANSFIAYTSYARSGGWKGELHELFTEYCDVSMPQAYWAARPQTPKEEIVEMEANLGVLYDKWHNKPIMPMGQGGKLEIGRDVYPGETKEFCDLLFEKGYFGVSLFKYEIISGVGWEEYSECFNVGITFTAHSPIDLTIIDPDGLVVNKSLNEIWGASYMEFDVDGDGDLDDIVTILYGKLGNYSIGVIPEPEATPTDTFTLVVSTQTETIVLAENVAISEIPSEPYIFEHTSVLYTFLIVWGEETFVVSVESNSIVSNFAFNQPAKEISFNVTGEDGTIGFCNVTIPKALLYAELGDWIVLIDGASVLPTITENETHTSLYFTYTHSTHEIQIIGTWVIGPPPDTNPPLINTPFQEPESDKVMPDQAVTVYVNVTDMESGVKNVILSYTTNGGAIWNNLTMLYNATSMLYQATIPAFPSGTNICYKVIAYDNADNVAINDNAGQYYCYTVSPLVPPLSVSISPLSASILVGQSVTFTSTVSGGYTPYSYQWYLNGNPVSGAASASWTFTPTTSGIYYVHLKVTDDKGDTAQSETARITVATVPVGGYSIPIQLPTTAKPVTIHIALLIILTAIFVVKLKPKTKRKR